MDVPLIKPIASLSWTPAEFLICHAVLPGYVPGLSQINDRSIYTNGLQAGWRLTSSSNITIQNMTLPGREQTALCVNMPALRDQVWTELLIAIFLGSQESVCLI